MIRLFPGAARRRARNVSGHEESRTRLPETAAQPAEPWAVPHDSRASAADIFYCFRLLLNRSPSRGEWTGHVARAGEDLESVASSYVNAHEFAKRGLIRPASFDNLTCGDAQGFKIWASRDDLAVGRHALNGCYEPHVTKLFRGRLKPGMRVVDVGANIGYLSLLAASLVGVEGDVLAVEPSPANARLIEASRRTNGFEHLRVLQAAAGREPGILAFYPEQSNGMAAEVPDDVARLLAAETVGCVSLDGLLDDDRPVHLIKADVEGAEHSVFLGAARTIGRWRPWLVWEYTPEVLWGVSGIHWRDHLQWVIGQGYRIKVCHIDGHLEDCDTPEAVQAVFEAGSHGHLDLLAEPA